MIAYLTDLQITIFFLPKELMHLKLYVCVIAYLIDFTQYCIIASLGIICLSNCIYAHMYVSYILEKLAHYWPSCFFG